MDVEQVDDPRRFWRVLLVIVGLALAFRVGYVLIVNDDLVKDAHWVIEIVRAARDFRE